MGFKCGVFLRRSDRNYKYLKIRVPKIWCDFLRRMIEIFRIMWKEELFEYIALTIHSVVRAMRFWLDMGEKMILI
jgi:hypothetical protein